MKKTSLLEKLNFKKRKKHTFLDRFILFLLVFGGVMILFLIGQTIYGRLPQVSLAHHLPVDKTVALIEIEEWRLPQEFNVPGKEDLVTAMNAWAGFDLKAMVQGFGTGAVALAFFEAENAKNYPVFFIQAKTERAAINYFESLLLPGEKLNASQEANPIYDFPQGQGISFRFFDRYVAVSQAPEAFDLLPAEETEFKALSEDENFIKTTSQMPRRSWAFLYADLKRLDFSENTGVNNVLIPLKNTVHNIAFSLREEQKGWHFNSFLNVNKELLSLAEQGGSSFKYELTQFIPQENLALYFGGENLAAEWENTLNTISNLNPAYGLILEGLLRAQTDKIFGQNVDLRNDLYPLFEGEYAALVHQGKTGKELSLILTHDDEMFVKRKMEKMAQGFKFLAASFAPKVSVVTLPDGTESRELVPDDAQVKTETETENGYEIHCTELGETGHGFCYALNDELVILSSSRDILMKSIAAEEGAQLADHASYRRSLSNLSKVSQEIAFIDFEHFTPLFSDRPYIKLFSGILASLDSATWVKHYFDDGMSSEGFLLLK